MALFDSFKPKKDPNDSKAGGKAGDTGFGNGVFVQDPRKARKFFDYAETAAQARNYDLALDYYASGLRFDPDNLKRHQELRETALKRKSAGGKSAGMMGIPKIGDTAVDKMLTAEKEWAMDPSSPKLLLAAINAGLAAQAKANEIAPPPAEAPSSTDSAAGMTIDGLHLEDIIFWMAEQCLDVIHSSSKPDKNHYMALVEVFRKLFNHNDAACDKALEAAKRAVQLDSGNSDLIMALKNLDAEVYTRRNTNSSSKKGSFRENLHNAKEQSEIQAEITTSGVGVDDLISKRRSEWMADRDNLDLLQKLVDVLLKKEDMATEKEAVALLMKAYEVTKEYRHRMRAADIQMHQFNRITTELKKRYEASKKPEDKEMYAKVRSKQGKFELEHYLERSAQYPTDMKVRFELGKRQWKGQLFDDAIGSFQGAKNDPKSRAESSFYLGLCYGQKGWLDEAVESLEAAMDEHQFEDDRLGKEIRYELMLALARAAKGEGSIEKAEKAQKIASGLLQIDINYKDIREKIDVIRALVKKAQRAGLKVITSPVVALIPARFASTRLPGKMLLAETGMPVIVHVAQRARQCQSLMRVVVCADDERICAAVRAHGGEAVMTRVDHPNGTSRLAEAADLLHLAPEAVVLNIQGDEPEIEPDVVDRLAAEMLAHPTVPMGTVATPFPAGDSALDPNIVKVVVSQHRRALYFSRAPIPWDRDAGGPGACKKHMGLYAYRRSFLPVYAAMAPTPLEQAEKLEQLRVLEHGYAIAVIQAKASPAGIDTREQYEAFVKRWQGKESRS